MFTHFPTRQAGERLLRDRWARAADATAKPDRAGAGAGAGSEAARWNRLGEAVKTRKKREKTGGKMGEIWPKTCQGVGITWHEKQQRSVLADMIDARAAAVLTRREIGEPGQVRFI